MHMPFEGAPSAFERRAVSFEDQAVARSVDELNRLANSPNIRKPVSEGSAGSVGGVPGYSLHLMLLVVPGCVIGLTP